MFENINIKDIILIILVIVVFYLLYKISTLSEKFDITTDTTTINQAITDIYKVDFDAMRNLGQIAQQILQQSPGGTDTFNIPASNTVIENLKVNGDVIFTNKNSNIMEIFPKYMVISWASNDIPKGWAICDGNKYIIDANGNNIINVNGIQTPDLRGRFILGSGSGNNLKSRFLTQTGGAEDHKLELNEMPYHSHNIDWSMIGCKGNQCVNKNTWIATDILFSGDGNEMSRVNKVDPLRYPHNTSITGGKLLDTPAGQARSYETVAHNNMPPFYVLTYIMKL
jgi:microcystin-dependent protein